MNVPQKLATPLVYLNLLLGKLLRPTGRVDITYYPEVSNQEELATLVNRAAWYLPPFKSFAPTIRIPVAEHLLGLDPAALPPPAGQEKVLARSPISLVASPPAAGASQAWFCWKLVLDAFMLRCFHRFHLVDPDFYAGLESEIYRTFLYRSLPDGERQELRDNFLSLYRQLTTIASPFRKAYLFGTGPSLDSSYDFDFSDGLRIACNSIVKDRQLLRHIAPQLIVFSDPVFHFSPSTYAHEFRRNLLEYVSSADCLILTAESSAPLLLAHFPELEGKLIGVPVQGRGGINFPTTADFRVKATDNVMTLFMIPVACALAEEICFLGVDGRRPEETYFWSHSRQSQFSDLMDTARQTHPSFFANRDYPGYYDRHCRTMETLLQYGEERGKRFYALTPSQLPCFAERKAP